MAAPDDDQHRPWHPQLYEAGRRLATARAAARTALAEARTQALAALSAGAPEVAVARILGVDRMTIRTWAGKRTPHHRVANNGPDGKGASA